MRTGRSRTRGAAILAATWLATGIGAAQEAAGRDEHARMQPLVIRVVDENGAALGGVQIEARQTASDCRFGCNLFLFGRCPAPELEEAYRARFADLLDFATLPFYWWTYERERGRTEAARIGEMAAWCRERGIATKGHPLLWNHADPAWLPDDVEEVRRLSLARAHDCTEEYAGRIDVWDVVNEATHFDREGMRGTKQTRTWKETGVIELIRTAFAQAREANPRATLLINDYRTDEAYAKLIEALREPDGGFPFDVIGIQSHMHGGVWSDARIDEVCRRFARFGLPLHFTEVTIVSGPRGERGAPWRTTPDGEARQAREVERVYRRLFAHPEVEAITWWDLSDHGAWQNAPAGLLRADMTPKPAYEALRRLITKEWRSGFAGRTNADGALEARGYCGTWELRYYPPRRTGDPISVRLVLTAKEVRWGPDLANRGDEVRIVVRGSDR